MPPGPGPADAPYEEVEAFRLGGDPDTALDRAQVYLEGAGTVAPSLRGHLERHGDALVVHHGRVETRITARPGDGGTHLLVSRRGKVPLEDTRMLLFGIGIAGFVLAWALAWYNERATAFLSPLTTIVLFFAALIAAAVGLFIVDRSLERRSRSLMASLADAMAGPPLPVLEREVDALERTTAVANGLLFYGGSLIVEFLVFMVLRSDGVRQATDQALTLEVMQWGFGLPIVPAILFGVLYRAGIHRTHQRRLRDVARRWPDTAGQGGPSRFEGITSR